MRTDLARRLAAEALGTSLLLIAVVGSGIMAERLAAGNMAVALLANAIATGAALVVLITIFGPLSGAHFNPCVSLYFALRREMPLAVALAYSATQMVSAVLGVWLAHVMFGMAILETSAHLRSGPALMLAEFIATFGLLATIAGGVRFAAQDQAVTHDTDVKAAANANIDAAGDTSKKYVRKNRAADFAKEQSITAQLNQQASAAASPSSSVR